MDHVVDLFVNIVMYYTYYTYYTYVYTYNVIMYGEYVAYIFVEIVVAAVAHNCFIVSNLMSSRVSTAIDACSSYTVIYHPSQLKSVIGTGDCYDHSCVKDV